MRALSWAAGVGVAASCARLTATADMETVETTAAATIVSIMALSTCKAPSQNSTCQLQVL